jgi:hypothetical protein
MRPVPTYTGHTLTNATRHIKGRIDAENTVHVMHHLSALYSKPELACLREYSTNARDSHIAAGTPDRPIEVTLPTEDKLALVIQDYGVGLGMDDLEETFLSYGASTKRDTDDETGSLGFGSKAAMAYAPLGWQVSSVQDGYKIHAVVSRDEFGVPDMGILFEGATSEPNGVRITIPVEEDDVDTFRSEAHGLFRFWAPGTVLVDGEQPATIWDDPKVVWLDESVALLPQHSYQSTIVMGGQPYRLAYQSPWGHAVVAFVEMGAVSFTPSREELNLTPRTIELIEDLKSFVADRTTERMVDHVAEATTPWDRLVRYESVSGQLNSYGTRDLLEDLRRRTVHLLPRQAHDYPSGPRWTHTDAEGKPVWSVEEDRPVYKWDTGAYRNSVDRIHRVTPATFGLGGRYGNTNVESIIIVTDFPHKTKTLSPIHRFHISEWLSQQGRGRGRAHVVVLPGGVNEIEFLAGHPCTTIGRYEEIVALTPRPKAERGSRSKGTYDVWVNESREQVFQDEIDSEVVLYSTTKNGHYYSKRHPDVAVVDITSRQVDKLRRLYPEAQEAHVYDHEQVEAAAEALTEDDRLAMTAGSDWAWLKTIDAEDPDLRRVLRSVDGRTNKRIEKARRLNVTPVVPPQLAELNKRYPLLPILETWSYKASKHLGDVELYVNAAYRELEYQRLAEDGNIDNVEEVVADGHGSI